MSKSGMGGHQSASADTTRWLTPSWITDPLGEFDLDPCGAPGHAIAKRTYLLESGDDGLRDPWEGRVWLNPPYGREHEDWLRKLADHGQGTALIFARTETRVFFEQVWDRATALLFLYGRIYFLDADGIPAKANSGAPSVLIAYGREDARLLWDSSIEGQRIAL